MKKAANASPGMGVADHNNSTYLELQRKKVHRYVIFKIDEKKKEVVVEKTGGLVESYDDFTVSLPNLRLEATWGEVVDGGVEAKV
ncbi:Actin-depolymerizing factor 6 [Camellia lanceoleosa]|uniref:Actin-depolymerizing factor 6 n=1 Tax=Camellia lanceoleosa TaxID=1840588 RepID=A0ACC0HKN1_9ERIC|nr:Actin-depolymerizing factor 6 [Camellia lanceoleosa]